MMNSTTAPAVRSLIVNADDFGQSRGINRGVIAAFERGIVTSASLMVRWPAAMEAATYAREHPELSAGLHFDLGEWTCTDGEWRVLYSVVPNDDGDAVATELERQVGGFHELLHRAPTHIDSHQHAHRKEPVLSVVRAVATRLGVPLRDFDDRVQYCGDFYGQTANGVSLSRYIGVAALISLLNKLPAGITELGCHPGEGADLETMYLHERAREVRTLCDPRVRAAIQELGISLLRRQRPLDTDWLGDTI